MRDPDQESPPTPQAEPVSERLSRSLTTIWHEHAGARPSSVSVELSGDRVRFVMQDAISSIVTEPTENGDGTPEIRSPDSLLYQHEAQRAVARITGRRVRGFIPRRDKKTDVATDIYILEPVHTAR